jgi:hypothetical protein
MKKAEVRKKKPTFNKYSGIDPGISQIVRILAENGVGTFQSCAASGPFGRGAGKRTGDLHSYPQPTVEFSGSFAAGFHALNVAITHGLPVAELRRVWSMQDREPVGPHWAMTFALTPKNMVGWLAPDAQPYKKSHGKCYCGGLA